MSSRCSETLPCPSLTLLETISVLRAKSGSNKLLKFGRRRFNSGRLRDFRQTIGNHSWRSGTHHHITRYLRKAFRINAMPIIMPNRCWGRRQFADSFRIDNIDILVWIKHLIMVPKKRFGVKYTRQPAPEQSSLDEGINPYLPPQAEKKLWKSLKGMPPAHPTLLRLLKAAMTRANKLGFETEVQGEGL